GKLLRRAIQADKLESSIFYGPPGCGKTSLAYIIANTSGAEFVKLNAVSAGVAEVREVITDAERRKRMYGKTTYILLDECHRWNKAQSDSVLPALEKGTIRLIGSTTENPFISMTPAFLSRCRIFEFKKLTKENIITALKRALADNKRGFGAMNVIVHDECLEHWASVANGDVRSALNALELAVLTTNPNSNGEIVIDLTIAEEAIQKPVLACDETQYYDMLSAFCKSLRGSDADAALAWAAKLIAVGMDPRIIVRRIIAHSSEDVGLADPQALVQAISAYHAVEAIGMPECLLAISQAIIYVCEAPKSNSVLAIHSAMEDAQKYDYVVPRHLSDSSYKGHERLDRGIGYIYPHDFPGHYVQQEYMPPAVAGKKYYIPGELGFEKEIRKRRADRGKKEDK
ncbi:MAG TPA: replication-associated recombination protein A, partial [Clostridia bacterium]|nr:replication-associated recombination protein A [Clostridia bacterium]